VYLLGTDAFFGCAHNTAGLRALVPRKLLLTILLSQCKPLDSCIGSFNWGETSSAKIALISATGFKLMQLLLWGCDSFFNSL